MICEREKYLLIVLRLPVAVRKSCLRLLRAYQKPFTFRAPMGYVLSLSLNNLSFLFMHIARTHNIPRDLTAALANCRVHKLSAGTGKIGMVCRIRFIFIRCRFHKENENAVIQKYCTVAHRHFMIAAEFRWWRI